MADRDLPETMLKPARLAVWAQTLLAKVLSWRLLDAPQRVFEITPLVPGSPSLDARPHSPGGTRQSERKK
jgi:hypothetical protein